MSRALRCGPEVYRTIASNQLLAPALRLARAVNALRALRDAIVPSRALTEGHRLRQSRNLFLFLGAALYEALLVLDNIGPEFGDLASFKQHLLPYRRSSDWRDLRENVLKPIRNNVAFHVNRDILGPVLDQLDYSVYEFAIQDGGPTDEPYYELADEALVPAAFGSGAYASVGENLFRYVNDVVVYTGYYCRAADAVLADVATRLGFTWASTEAVTT